MPVYSTHSTSETAVMTSSSSISVSTSGGSTTVKRQFSTSSTSTPLPPPDYIPKDSERTARTIVMCFDGTGDQFDLDNSNIVQLFSMLKKDDRTKQMVYYQTGIGTTGSAFASQIMNKISMTLDEAVAWNLGAHIMEGYEFLMQNYSEGDKICIFGFSRGAYTARCLAGMIHKVGVLPPCNHQQVPFAYKMFTDDSHTGWHQAHAFKKAFSVNVNIAFLGVWDTVNSVGFIPRRLAFTKFNPSVLVLRHAVALDERRAKFQASHWKRKLESKPGSDSPISPSSQETAVQDIPDGCFFKDNQKLKKFEKAFGGNTITDVEEVWFAGAHCDVGGGSVKNGTCHSLAAIALRWMIRECFKVKTGIIFDTESLRDIGILPEIGIESTSLSATSTIIGRSPVGATTLDIAAQHALEAIPPERKEAHPYCNNRHEVSNMKRRLLSEDVLDLRDAMAPIYDQLSLAWSTWWWMEYLPKRVKVPKAERGWFSWLKFTWNGGQPREIPKPGKDKKIRVHHSVKLRMIAQPLGKEGRYVPGALLRALGVKTAEEVLNSKKIDWVA